MMSSQPRSLRDRGILILKTHIIGTRGFYSSHGGYVDTRGSDNGNLRRGHFRSRETSYYFFFFFFFSRKVKFTFTLQGNTIFTFTSLVFKRNNPNSSLSD